MKTLVASLFVLIVNSIDILAQTTDLIPYRKGDQWGYCDKNKKIIIEPTFDWAGRFIDGLAKVTKDNKDFYINTRGEIVEKTESSENGREETKTDLNPFKQNDLYGYKNSKGEIKIKPTFEDAEDFSEGLAAIKLNNKWGYIDKKGNRIIECKYDEARVFYQGLALVAFNGSYGFISTNGTEYWDEVNCSKTEHNWINRNVKLNYEINYDTKLTILLERIENDISFTWYKNDNKGFRMIISPNAINQAYKHYNYIYSFSFRADSLLLPEDVTTIFCSRQMFKEMVQNKKVTFYPYAEPGIGNSDPVEFHFKGSKIVCVKQNNTYIGLDCLVFESISGERIVVLNNPQFPLIVQMGLDFNIYLKSIE